MKQIEALIETELQFEEEINSFLMSSDKLSCKLPEYKSAHNKPVLDFSFSELVIQAPATVIIKNTKKTNSKQLW